MEAQQRPQRPPFLETLKSPVGPGAGPYPGVEEAGDPLDDALTGQRRAEPYAGRDGGTPYPGPPGEPGRPILPPSLSVKNTIPLGTVFRGMVPSSQSPQAPPASASQKPGWQASFNRALVWVGRESEELARRYRGLPQNSRESS